VVDSLRLFDYITLLYGISLLFYFVDFVQSNKRVNRIAFWTLAGVWLLETVFFVLRMRALDYIPVFTRFEATMFFSWLLISFALIINYFYKMHFFTFFANLIGFTFVAFDTFARKGATQIGSVAHGNEDLLVIHISMAFISYAAFSLACIVSIMYLVQHRLLKTKQWSPFFQRMPALDRLESITFKLILVGFPALLIAMILGAIWYRAYYGYFLLVDPKPIVSMVLFVLYGLYLYLRVSAGWSGQKLAWLGVIGFMIVIVNYVIVGSFMSGFHKWG